MGVPKIRRAEGHATPRSIRRTESEEGGGRPRAGAPVGDAGEARRRALFVGTPREVLARIANGDPLGLRDLVSQHVRARCLVLDADRLHLRALAHCARRSGRLGGGESLNGFLRDRVREAADELLAEAEEGRGVAAGGTDAPDAFDEIAHPLDLDPRRARAAAAAFHACDPAERRAFVELLVEGRDLDELARHTGETVTRVARRARRALEAALAELTPRTERALRPGGKS